MHMLEVLKRQLGAGAGLAAAACVAGSAGRRLFWRIHLGRARPAARRPERHIRYGERHFGRRDQCGFAGCRAGRRGPARGARQARPILGTFEPNRGLRTFRRGRGIRAGAGSFSFWTRLLSPYQYNPLDLNPLRGLLNEEVDFDRLRRAAPIGLLIAATRVCDGRARIFSNCRNQCRKRCSLRQACRFTITR